MPPLASRCSLSYLPRRMSKKPPPSASVIRLHGVRHNNLKGFDLDLPLGKLIVVTGLSGSGKSSLAFDTLYAEGQRRYIETFSPYARQFFDRMDKPRVDSIEGIPPAIAIEQRNAVRTTRSTVGTMTEICDHLKILWPHLATLHCRKCGKPVEKEPPQKVWERVNAEHGMRNAECLVTFDLALSEKLALKESLDLIARQGYQRLLLNGEMVRLDDALVKLRSAEHRSAGADEHTTAEQCPALRRGLAALTIVQDRLKLAAASRARFIEACEQAYHFGKGKLAIYDVSNDPAIPHSALHTPHFFSNRFHCAQCDLDYREPSPALFSFNHPVGACPACKGFGRVIGIDYELAIPDRSISIKAGAVKPWRTGTGAESLADLAKFCKKLGVPMDVPFRDLSEAHQRWVIDGDPGYDSNDPANSWPKKWYGVKGYFRWLESKSYKMHVRVLLSRYRSYTRCPACEGKRLQPESLLYRVEVPSLTGLSADTLPLTPALSRWERETRSPRLAESKRPAQTPPLAASFGSHATAPSTRGTSLQLTLTAIPPLPAGEGRGEGERPVQLTLADFYSLSVSRALAVITALHERLFPISHLPSPISSASPLAHALEEVRSRLAYLVEVGLGYLTLDRATRTLSGGETERVNLTTCLGTRLVNTLYVLDEPSVGLHPRDTARLVVILQRLRDLGNTVIVVEHEAAVMRAADQIVDLGPGHGETGGELVFQGTLAELLRHPVSLTGQYLSGRKMVEERNPRPVELRGAASSNNATFPLTPALSPREREERSPRPGESMAVRSQSSTASRETRTAIPPLPQGEGRGEGKGIAQHSDGREPSTNSPAHFLTLSGASAHNLKNLTVSIPLGRFVCLTGVSGSGKSTLVRDCLLPALASVLKVAETQALPGETDDKVTKTDIKPSGQEVKLIGFDVKQIQSDVKPSGSDIKLSGSDVKLSGSGNKVYESGVQFSDLNAKVDDSGVKPSDFDEPSGEFVQPGTARVIGAGHLSRFILVDQTPLGKTPRSTPAVYIGAFDDLREVFAQTELARQRGLNSSAFSFNSAAGQCDRCRGAGFEKIEMQFLSDVFIKCPACEGRRYREHILEVKVEVQASRFQVSGAGTSAGRPHAKASVSTLNLEPETLNLSWSIADLLAASVDESLAFLAALPDSKPAQRAAAALRVLQEVGLGYLRLGQPINTLSGGESQRLKLAAHLAEASSRESRVESREPEAAAVAQPSTLDPRLSTLFVFDEPTTGLHFEDVRVLVAVFQRLVDAGHTVLVIEHNLDVIRAADWLIDLGPEAGAAGGELVIAGTPEEVAKCERSHTGRFLRDAL